MYFQKVNNTTLIIIIISVVTLMMSNNGVEASRVLSQDFAGANHLEKYTSSIIYERAKNTMACWLERLASGPSPRGRGH